MLPSPLLLHALSRVTEHGSSPYRVQNMCCTLSAHLAPEGPPAEIPHILPTFILISLKVRIAYLFRYVFS